jgi:hypothetical protein
MQRIPEERFTMSQQNQPTTTTTRKFNVSKLEERIAPSNAKFPPGQFPAGNPAQAPGNSNPNENGGPKK